MLLEGRGNFGSDCGEMGLMWEQPVYNVRLRNPDTIACREQSGYLAGFLIWHVVTKVNPFTWCCRKRREEAGSCDNCYSKWLTLGQVLYSHLKFCLLLAVRQSYHVFGRTGFGHIAETALLMEQVQCTRVKAGLGVACHPPYVICCTLCHMIDASCATVVSLGAWTGGMGCVVTKQLRTRMGHTVLRMASMLLNNANVVGYVGRRAQWTPSNIIWMQRTYLDFKVWTPVKMVSLPLVHCNISPCH